MCFGRLHDFEKIYAGAKSSTNIVGGKSASGTKYEIHDLVRLSVHRTKQSMMRRTTYFSVRQHPSVYGSGLHSLIILTGNTRVISRKLCRRERKYANFAHHGDS